MSPGGGAGELNEMKGWCHRQDAGVKVAVILRSKVFSQGAENFRVTHISHIFSITCDSCMRAYITKWYY